MTPHLSIRTLWWCENCGAEGAVDHRADAGVWQLYQAIADAHAKTACATGLDRVRVTVDQGREDSAHVARRHEGARNPT